MSVSSSGQFLFSTTLRSGGKRIESKLILSRFVILKAAAAEGDYEHIVVSGFACIDDEGRVEEVELLVRGELLTNA